MKTITEFFGFVQKKPCDNCNLGLFLLFSGGKFKFEFPRTLQVDDLLPEHHFVMQPLQDEVEIYGALYEPGPVLVERLVLGGVEVGVARGEAHGLGFVQ